MSAQKQTAVNVKQAKLLAMWQQRIASVIQVLLGMALIMEPRPAVSIFIAKFDIIFPLI